MNYPNEGTNQVICFSVSQTRFSSNWASTVFTMGLLSPSFWLFPRIIFCLKSEWLKQNRPSLPISFSVYTYSVVFTFHTVDLGCLGSAKRQLCFLALTWLRFPRSIWPTPWAARCEFYRLSDVLLVFFDWALAGLRWTRDIYLISLSFRQMMDISSVVPLTLHQRDLDSLAASQHHLLRRVKENEK